MAIVDLEFSEKIQPQFLRINPSNREVRLSAQVFKFRDQDTRQIVFFLPSLEITGYGSDDRKAIEMFTFALNSYMENLFTLSTKEVKVELEKYGWKRERNSARKFSNVCVDIEGQLRNFNAVADAVEQLSVQV